MIGSTARIAISSLGFAALAFLGCSDNATDGGAGGPAVTYPHGLAFHSCFGPSRVMSFVLDTSPFADCDDFHAGAVSLIWPAGKPDSLRPGASFDWDLRPVVGPDTFWTARHLRIESVSGTEVGVLYRLVRKTDDGEVRDSGRVTVRYCAETADSGC